MADRNGNRKVHKDRDKDKGKDKDRDKDRDKDKALTNTMVNSSTQCAGGERKMEQNENENENENDKLSISDYDNNSNNNDNNNNHNNDNNNYNNSDDSNDNYNNNNNDNSNDNNSSEDNNSDDLGWSEDESDRLIIYGDSNFRRENESDWYAKFMEQVIRNERKRKETSGHEETKSAAKSNTNGNNNGEEEGGEENEEDNEDLVDFIRRPVAAEEAKEGEQEEKEENSLKVVKTLDRKTTLWNLCLENLLKSNDSFRILDYLNADLHDSIFQFLWGKDLARCQSVCKCYRGIANEKKFGKRIACMLWEIGAKVSLQGQSVAFNKPLSDHLTPLNLARSIAFEWPTCIDTSRLRNSGIHKISVSKEVDGKAVGIMFKGEAIIYDRVVFADKPFPLAGLSCPFSWVRCTSIKDNGLKEFEFHTGFIAYYEITIGPNTRPPDASRTRRYMNSIDPNQHNCVAIGLGRQSFPETGYQPGWCSESYGYHGDDGCLYHGSGTNGRRYGETFGAGDTIGCGLVYRPHVSNSRSTDVNLETLMISFDQSLANHTPTGYVFFTKNGRNLGDAYTQVNLSHQLYPIIGIDAFNEITVNFTGPFSFDLQAGEVEQLSGIDLCNKQDQMCGECSNRRETILAKVLSARISRRSFKSWNPYLLQSYPDPLANEREFNGDFYSDEDFDGSDNDIRSLESVSEDEIDLLAEDDIHLLAEDYGIVDSGEDDGATQYSVSVDEEESTMSLEQDVIIEGGNQM